MYVDEMRICLQTRSWPYTHACHLVADSVEELQEFAIRLGMHPSWFQGGSMPHYDLTTRVRKKAVRMGAFEIKKKKFLKLMKKYRQRGD